MSDSTSSLDALEVESNLTSIKGSVDKTITGMDDRNKKLHSSSKKYFQYAQDIKNRLSTLHRYGMALTEKKQEVKNEINIFQEDKNRKLSEMNKEELELQSKIKQLEENVSQIIININNIHESKVNYSKQIQKYEKEIIDYDDKLNSSINIVPEEDKSNLKEEISQAQQKIAEMNINMDLINNKIAFKAQLIDKMKKKYSLLEPSKEIVFQLNILKLKNDRIDDEKKEILDNVNLTHESINAKCEALNDIKNQIQAYEKNVKFQKENQQSIQSIKSQIQNENKKIEDSNIKIQQYEEELQNLQQENIKENQENAKLAELSKIMESKKLLLTERSQEYIFYEKELTKVLADVDKAKHLEYTLIQENENIDERINNNQEKVFFNIKEADMFYKNKLLQQLSDTETSIKCMENEIENMEMRLNVLEAEKLRLTKKIAYTNKTISKLQSEETILKSKNDENQDEQTKSKIKKASQKSKSNHILKIKINNLRYIIANKKDNIKIKNSNIEQMLFRILKPNQETLYNTSNSNILNEHILEPLVPFLNNRAVDANAIFEAAKFSTKLFNQQKNEWSSINQNDIREHLKAWEDILYKITPIFDQIYLRALLRS